MVPAPVDGRRLPEVVALGRELPTVAELFDFMRDAERRFGTLRLRIEERAGTSRGEDLTTMDTVLRHPGDARVTTTRPGEGVRAEYEVWISDGDLVRTYSSVHRLGTQRPIRNRPRGLDDHDFPGPAKVYEPITPLPAETLPDTFVHPAGYCQNVLSTGRCTVTGTDIVSEREAILLECDHPRTTETRRRSARLPHLDRGRSRHRRHPSPGRDDRRDGHPRRRRRRAPTRRTPPGHRLRLRLPLRDDDALLSRTLPIRRGRPYHRPRSADIVRKGGPATDPAPQRGHDGRPWPPSRQTPRHLAHPRVSRAAPRTGCSRRSGRRPDDRSE